jgi:hypothetical protein
MRQTRHLSTNIEGLLRNYKGRKINIFTDDDGNTMSDSEVRKEIAELQAKGHKLIGSDGCKGFDPFGGGCPGHSIKE